MRTIVYASIFLAFFSQTIDAGEPQKLQLRSEVIAPDQLVTSGIDPEYIESIGADHYVTIVSAENLPAEGDEFLVDILRPLLNIPMKKNPYHQHLKISRKGMLSTQVKTNRENPVARIIGSIGFLPGERVKFVLRDKERGFLGQTEFIPYPIEKVSRDGRAKVVAEYYLMYPSTYSIHLSGFEEGERVFFESQSAWETFDKHEIAANSGISCGNGVEGLNGGISTTKIERKNGEVFVLRLPWGNELVPYLEGKISPKN